MSKWGGEAIHDAVVRASHVDAVALRVTSTPPAAAGQSINIGEGLTNMTVVA